MLRKGHILVISVIIASFVTVPAFAATNVVIYEVEPNPIGTDQGTWVRLFNPLDYRMDLSGWKIESSRGPITLTDSVGPCAIIKITFPTQFMDHKGESLILYDNKGRVVDTTPPISDPYLTRVYTWINPNVILDCTKPITEEVGMGFYENSRYEFSFEAPTDWKYQEGISIDGETIYQVLVYPYDFSLENESVSSVSLQDLDLALLGLGFQIDSPLIGVLFENVLKSEVPRLNEAELKEYVLEKIRTEIPSTKILDSYAKTESWGWEVEVFYAFDFQTGYGSGMPYLAEEITYFFKDRESYTVFYMAHEDYYDHYRPVFDHAVNTLMIKGVTVPEFQEIALMVLGSSIVLVIVFARKFASLSKSENS